MAGRRLDAALARGRAGCAVILLKCACGKTLQVPDHTAAKRGKCPHCGQLLPLPPTVRDYPPKLVAGMTGHKGPIRFATFSPNSRLLVTAGGSEGGVEAGAHKFAEIRIWDAQGGRQLAAMQGHQDTVLCAAFTPDSQTLITGSKDHTICVWDVSHGMHGVVMGLKSHTLRTHEGRVSSLAATHDGSLVISGSDDGTIRFWDAKTWRTVDTLTTGRSGLCQLAVSSDGAWLAAVWRSRGPAILWDLRTRQESLCLHLRPEEDAEDFDLAFSPTGKLLGILSNRDVRLWDLSSCQVLVDIEAAGVRSLAFSPDGKTLATGGWDPKTNYNVQLWDTDAGQELRRLSGNEKSVYSVAYSPDGHRIASGGRDQIVRIWEPGTA